MGNHTTPLSMTTSREWEPTEAGDGELLGRPLSRRFTRYLEHAERTWRLQQRLEQLKDVDPRAHRAVVLHMAGTKLAAISATLSCSRATTYRLIALGYRSLGSAADPPPRPLDDVGRMAILRVTDRVAWTVYVMSGQRCTQTVIASHLGISTSTVKRAHARAKAYMDTP